MKKISTIVTALLLITGISFASAYQAKPQAKGKTEKKTDTKKKEVKKVPARKTVAKKTDTKTTTPAK